MKTISSNAGTRLARARASERGAFAHWCSYPTPENHEVWGRCRVEFDSAGAAVADELIAQGFHLAEGDDA